MPLTQAEVDALRNATRAYGGSVEIAPRAYVDPNVQAQFNALADRVAAQGRPAAPVRTAPAPDVQAQFDALAESIVPQTIQNAPAPQTIHNAPPVIYQRDPYARAGYMAGPDGSVTPLVGYPSRYPHVLNGVPQNYAAPYLENAWGMLGPWIAPPDPAVIESLVEAVRQPRAEARPRPDGAATTQRRADAKPAPDAAAPQRNTGDYAADAAIEAMGAPQFTTPAPAEGSVPEVRGPYNGSVLENPYNGYMMGLEGGDRSMQEIFPASGDPLENLYNGYMMGLVAGGEAATYPEVRGAYSNEVRAPYSNEVRGAYNSTPVPPVAQDIGVLGISPLARDVMQNPLPAPVALPEVRGPYTTEVRGPVTGEVRGPVGAVRGAYSNEVRGPYSNAVRGAIIPSILYNGQLANVSR